MDPAGRLDMETGAYESSKLCAVRLQACSPFRCMDGYQRLPAFSALLVDCMVVVLEVWLEMGDEAVPFWGYEGDGIPKDPYRRPLCVFINARPWAHKRGRPDPTTNKHMSTHKHTHNANVQSDGGESQYGH